VPRGWDTEELARTFKTSITVEDVLNSRMIAYPFRYCGASWRPMAAAR
jgi:hypothetical protein